MGWIIALGIIAVLAILPLGVSARYNANGLLVKVIAGPVRFTVFPLRKKEKKEVIQIRNMAGGKSIFMRHYLL